jgi:hypothetical protein
MPAYDLFCGARATISNLKIGFHSNLMVEYAVAAFPQQHVASHKKLASGG